MFEIKNENMIVTHFYDEMKLYFLNMINDYKNNDFDYYSMCEKNICDFFKIFDCVQCDTMIKNDDTLYVVIFDKNKFKIISYFINDDFEFIRFDISYVYNVYDLFSTILNDM